MIPGPLVCIQSMFLKGERAGGTLGPAVGPKAIREGHHNFANRPLPVNVLGTKLVINSRRTSFTSP